MATTAVCAGEQACWVELDPSGGSGWLRTRASCPASESTLAELTRDLREGRTTGEWAALAVAAPPGVPAILAPSSEVAASTVIGEGPGRWADALQEPGLVVVDCGRWDRRQPTAARIAGSDVVAVVCRSTVESVEHVRHWVDGLRDVARCPVLVVVVGRRPYRGEEVADAVQLELAGEIDWRRNDVAALWARGARGRQVASSWLGRSASRTLAGIRGVVADRAGTGLATRVQGGDTELTSGRFAGS